jgi:hypothetical protein
MFHKSTISVQILSPSNEEHIILANLGQGASKKIFRNMSCVYILNMLHAHKVVLTKTECFLPYVKKTNLWGWAFLHSGTDAPARLDQSC